MAIEQSKRRIAAGRIATTARRLLDASALCAIATVAPDGRAHVNTAYFAWSLEFELVWMSDPSAKHSRNIRTNDTIAIAVYDSTQTWGTADRGIQLFDERELGPGMFVTARVGDAGRLAWERTEVYRSAP